MIAESTPSKALTETIATLKAAIDRERQHKETLAETSQAPLIRQGKGPAALENLIFFTAPGRFLTHWEKLQGEIRNNLTGADGNLQKRYLRFLVELTLSLRSFLPYWSLRDTTRYGDEALTGAQIQTAADQSQALANELAAAAPAAVEKLLAEWRAETLARLKAENAAEPEREAAGLVGDSIDEYLTLMRLEIDRSHLRRIAELRQTGQTCTEISNDYATFLPYALYLGASFVTCNPPLVDMTVAAEPTRWLPVVDRILAENPEADDDTLARLVTAEVVLLNMRLLRPIFLLTGGEMGYVCFQVNPNKHGDAAAMISDALLIYEIFQGHFDGGVPNVVFKLPGTQAGLETCHALTGRGIGVTITVDFGMFQHVPFAEAIQAGQAMCACLVEMNGRLAYPVRDELLARLDQLAESGIGETQAREAAAWAGVAVMKRLHNLLVERGYDLHRIRPLVASLRIYEGSGYENLPGAFPDITEMVGTGILSVFPNVRRAFDRQPEMKLEPRRIEAPVPAEILNRLAHSEIFKQAYYVAGLDGPHFKPEVELTLTDTAAVAAWLPIHNTLTEFIKSYDTFVGRIRNRKQVR